MGGDSDSELDLSSNVGGCAVIGAIYGGIKAAWAQAPTARAPGTWGINRHIVYKNGSGWCCHNYKIDET